MKKILSTFILLLFFHSSFGQGNFTDKRDGNIYKTITIAGVTWMAENLKFNAKDGAHSFDNNSDNAAGYGILYDWKTAMKVCPGGWHLPSGSEFQTLANHYDQGDTWKKVPTDSTSFGIQFGGMQDFEGTFSEMDESCYYWTSTEYDKSHAEYFSYLIINEMTVIDISRKEDIADINGTEKSNKYSVRCKRD